MFTAAATSTQRDDAILIDTPLTVLLFRMQGPDKDSPRIRIRLLLHALSEEPRAIPLAMMVSAAGKIRRMA